MSKEDQHQMIGKSAASRRPSPLQQASAAVKRWNDAYLVGQTVEVRRDDGSTLQTSTVSEAFLLGGHSAVTAVIMVRGISGVWSLDRVSAKIETAELLRRSTLELGEQLAKEKARMDWLDKHCSFVADSEYRIGPFKVGQLREMADAGLRQDAGLPPKPTTP